MRILLINDRFTFLGGTERYLSQLVSALTVRRHEVVVLTPDDTEPGPPLAVAKIHSIPPSHGLRGGLRVRPQALACLAEVDPDVIYLHNTLGGFSPVVLHAFARRRPTILYVHDVRLFCPNGRKILRRTDLPCALPLGVRCALTGCCRRDDESFLGALREVEISRWRLRMVRRLAAVAVPSQYMATELRRNRIPATRLAVIPYYTDREDRDPDPPAESFDLLWVGRFDGTKGFEEFVAALGQLRAMPWRAVVVGEGPGRGPAQGAVAEAGLGDRVRFAGRVMGDDLQALYRAARVVVMTSTLAESFGIVGIEAMAIGKPVVAFDVGGVREWLGDGETGFLVARKDAAGMADRIRLLLTHADLRHRMGRAGRAVVEARFRSEHHLTRLLDLFQAAVEQGPGAALAGRVRPERARVL